MDILNDDTMAYAALVRELQDCKVIVGAKQLRKAVLSGTADRVYLAVNADPAITQPLVTLCHEHGVAYHWVQSMTDLGRACGIEVGAAAAAAIRESVSTGIAVE